MRRAQESDAETKQAVQAAQPKVAEAKKTLAPMKSERSTALDQAAAAKRQNATRIFCYYRQNSIQCSNEYWQADHDAAEATGETTAVASVTDASSTPEGVTALAGEAALRAGGAVGMTQQQAAAAAPSLLA